MCSIYNIVKVKHDNGLTEVVPCDMTVELLALELGNMGLTYPLTDADGGAVLDRFTDLDAEIGQVEDELRATRKYDDQVGRPVDEFNCEVDEYIDLDTLNERLKPILDSMEAGMFVPSVKIKWRKIRKSE